MVFYNEDGDSKTNIVECSCGCHGIKVMRIVGDDSVYISPYTDNFYSKQIQGFFKNILHKTKVIWKIICGKEYELEELVITLKETDELINALQEIRKVDENESKEFSRTN